MLRKLLICLVFVLIAGIGGAQDVPKSKKVTIKFMDDCMPQFDVKISNSGKAFISYTTIDGKVNNATLKDDTSYIFLWNQKLGEKLNQKWAKN
jgi:hypothetical protein